MKENYAQALIVAYYLSKFDKVAYEELGFNSLTTTHVEIGRLLGVNPNSVKNMRDEFDPLHENPRAGWYQRQLRPSRAKVVEAFQDLSRLEMRDIVLEIITNPDFKNSDDFDDIVAPIINRGGNKKGKSLFISRGPTGRKAEEYFQKYHKKYGVPKPGILKDTRDDGCGYDFSIGEEAEAVQVEVKGLDGESGGISFTSKEWDIARKNRDSYYLVIVRNVSTKPEVQIIRDPYKVLSPKKSIFITTQIRWNVPEKSLPENNTT
ncbi:MAG: DUF3883 domain-containing protein [Candidatus Brocadiales bacterium]|nr:DUF3883 domain-containing protein [Candidatus Brocadiales bacterium]